jgi:hypothetical protein
LVVGKQFKTTGTLKDYHVEWCGGGQDGWSYSKRQSEKYGIKLFMTKDDAERIAKAMNEAQEQLEENEE